jgi:hypothetical protein
MPDTIHLRIKKGYAAELINDLIKADAVEAVEDDTVELTAGQKAALDKELEAIQQNPGYLLQWNEAKQKLKKN